MILCCFQQQAIDISILASLLIQPYLPLSFKWKLDGGEVHFSFELCLPSFFQFSISPALVLGKLKELCCSLVILHNCYLLFLLPLCNSFTPDDLVFHLDKSNIFHLPLPSQVGSAVASRVPSGSQVGCPPGLCLCTAPRCAASPALLITYVLSCLCHS